MSVNSVKPRKPTFHVGFLALVEGAGFLWRTKTVWKFILIPVCINFLLYTGIVFLAAYNIWHAVHLISSDGWWVLLLAIIALIVFFAGALFFASMFFVLVGSVVFAPFHDLLAGEVLKRIGVTPPETGWWKGVRVALAFAALHGVLFVCIQGVLWLFAFIPGIGSFFHVFLGFFVTAGFLAYEFLTPSFDMYGWSFNVRRSWSMRNIQAIFGFGTAVFIGLAIPIVNLFIPSIAFIGGIFLFQTLQPYETHKT